MKLKVIHWIVIIWIALIVFRLDLLIKYLTLFYGFIKLALTDISIASGFLNFKILDVAISVALIIILPLLYLIYRKSWTALQGKLNFSYALLLILICILIFSPLITNENPELSKNLSVTKLLPPLSSVEYVQLAGKKDKAWSEEDKFRQHLNKTIKPPFDEEIIFADSIEINESVIIYQGNHKLKIQKKEMLLKNGNLAIGNKFFLFGSDEFGRDNFTRLIYGTRISLFVGFGAVIISFFIGLILGFIAGRKGGIIDTALNRFAELFLSFPVIYLIILILALFGNSLFSVIVVLGISGWMTLFKIVRSEVVSIKQKDFFISAELIGLKKFQLLTKEILPVILAPVIVNLVFLFSNVILAEAALSYLGLGTGNLYPSWGAMISSGQEYIYKAWWMIVFPGTALILTLLAVNSSGRRIREIINPRLEK